MNKIIVYVFSLLLTTNVMASADTELSDKPKFKAMLLDCNIDPNVDHRVFLAFRTHNVMRSADLDSAAVNELTAKQYYRWRLLPSMNSFGCQVFQRLIPNINLATDLFVKDECSTIEFRTALRVIYDFTQDLKNPESASSKGQFDINSCTHVFDLSEDQDTQILYNKYFHHLYVEIGTEVSDGQEITYQSIETVLSNLPDNFTAIPESIKYKILARVYISNFNMLFDFMDKWMRQAYKKVEETPLMDNLEAAFDT